MEITIGKLLEGKPTVIKDKEYFETKEYCQPFIDVMKKFTDKFYCWVQTPSQLTLTNKEEDITYNKVWLQAVMPDKCNISGYLETYNLVYALDIRQPIYKVFKAYKDNVSGNLFCFDSQWLNVYELKPTTNFTDFNPIIKNLMELTNDSEVRFRKMDNEHFSSAPEERQQKLGELIEKSMLYEYNTKGGKVKIAPANVLKAYENVYINGSSKYYIEETKECSLFNYYNSFSSLITQDDKDIINRFEKNYLCLEMLNDELCK